MSDACKQVGVNSDQVAREQRRNPLFRMTARALLHTPDPKQRYDAIIALLNRMIGVTTFFDPAGKFITRASGV